MKWQVRVMVSRLVLCPYGIPAERRALCNALLLQRGADLDRLIDAPVGAEAFLKHLQRLSSMLQAHTPPIVLLTELMPVLERVVLLRERYEAALPALEQAEWVLFLDHDPPTFVAEALRHG